MTSTVLTCYCGKPATVWSATASGDSFEVKTCSEECATRLAKRFMRGRVGDPKGGIGPEVGPSPNLEEVTKSILKALADNKEA